MHYHGSDMKKYICSFIWLALAVSGSAEVLESKNEPIGEAPITALALFKNGVVSVMREVRPPAKGAFLLTDRIEPAHGTLWFSGAGDGFRLSTVSRVFERPLGTLPLNDICRAYDGCHVTVTFLATTANALDSFASKGNGMLTIFNTGDASIATEVTGTVVNLVAPEQAKNFSRDFGEDSNRYYYNIPNNGLQTGVASSNTHLTLRLESGQMVSIPIARIVSIHSEKINTTTKEEREVWRVEGAEKPLTMTYLASGATWAPAYCLNLLSDKKLNISMSAIIRNEMASFKDAEVNLISGFPNIEFTNRTSLMVPGSTLASFFQGLSRAQDSGRRGVMSQIGMQAITSNGIDSLMDFNLPQMSSEEASMDIHYRNVGKLTMDLGETLYFPLEQAEVAYERIVEWNIPDRRDEHGRIRNSEREKSNGEFWDTLCFRNPFKSPITTAPVEITDDTKVLGQSTITWINPGQQASVKITKALSVSGISTETEIDQQRPLIKWGGNTYRNPDVEGEFRIKNYRGMPVKVSVRLQASGEYLSASTEPTSRRVLETGVYGVNKRQEMIWTLSLDPGEEKTVTYRYSVLVYH